MSKNIFRYAIDNTTSTSTVSTSTATFTVNTTIPTTSPPEPCPKHRPSMCPKTVKLMKYHYPPYTVSKGGGEDGIFERVIKNLLGKCCSFNTITKLPCVDLIDGKTEMNHEDLNDKAGKNKMNFVFLDIWYVL